MIDVGEISHKIGPATVDTAKKVERPSHRIWPEVIVGLALSATVIWTFILGFGFVRLVELLI